MGNCRTGVDVAVAAGVKSADDVIHVWELETGKELHTLNKSKGQLTAPSFSPDGHLLAAAGGDTVVRLWDPVQGELKQELTGQVNPVRCLHFSPDGQLLASGAGGVVKVWGVATGKEAASLRLADDPCR